MLDHRDPTQRLEKLTWDSLANSGDINVPAIQASVVEMIAKHMAASHYDRMGGHGYAVAHHLHSTNPAEWEKWKHDAIFMLQAIHGSGEKGIGPYGTPKNSRIFFQAAHDLAAELRRI